MVYKAIMAIDMSSHYNIVTFQGPPSPVVRAGKVKVGVYQKFFFHDASLIIDREASVRLSVCPFVCALTVESLQG